MECGHNGTWTAVVTLMQCTHTHAHARTHTQSSHPGAVLVFPVLTAGHHWLLLLHPGLSFVGAGVILLHLQRLLQDLLAGISCRLHRREGRGERGVRRREGSDTVTQLPYQQFHSSFRTHFQFCPFVFQVFQFPFNLLVAIVTLCNHGLPHRVHS